MKNFQFSGVAVRRCSPIKVLLKILQKSQKYTYVRVSFEVIKFIKKDCNIALQRLICRQKPIKKWNIANLQKQLFVDVL